MTKVPSTVVSAANDLDALAFAFFREFARCEYCLKAVGIRKRNHGAPVADWTSFAQQVQHAFMGSELHEAVRYYIDNPPKKQVLRDGHLAWSNALPAHESQVELLLLLVCRVRNNLFHGGKFNSRWFEPQRSQELLRHGLSLLSAAVEAHPVVCEAYTGSAA